MNKQLFQIAFPTASDEIFKKYKDVLDIAIDKYDINGDHNLSAFLAHIGHESGDLKRIVENLNYSAERLLVVFPKYFKTQEEATNYARQPSRIASKVYANRMGNGKEESGDGWLYRGRGLIQLTGKSNYQRFGKHIGMDLDEVIPFLETPKGACISAGYFWSTNNCNDKTMDQSTRIINGGTHGLQDRKTRYERILKYFT